PEFDRPVAAQVPILCVRDVGHVTSRQFPRDTTPGPIPANHWRSNDVLAETCGDGEGGVIPRHGGIPATGRHPAVAPHTHRCSHGAGGSDPGRSCDLRRRVHHAGANDAVTPMTTNPAPCVLMSSSPWCSCNTPPGLLVKHATSP